MMMSCIIKSHTLSSIYHTKLITHAKFNKIFHRINPRKYHTPNVLFLQWNVCQGAEALVPGMHFFVEIGKFGVPYFHIYLILKVWEVRHDLVMVYKCINNLTPDYLRERFKQRSEIHQRNTRQKSELTLPKCRLAAGQRAFAFCGAKLFNSLPSKYIRDTESLSGFKGRIFKNMFNS